MRTAVLSVVGAGLAAVIVTLAVLAIVDSDEVTIDQTDVPVTVGELDVPDNDIDVVRSFLEAWWASRLATYIADGRFVRTLPDGSRRVSTRTVAQRPPDVSIRQSDDLRAVIDGEVVRCTTLPNGNRTCTSGTSEQDYLGTARAELEAFVTYFRGDPPVYALTAAGDCFELEIVRVVSNPPYGNVARLCFDPATGALVELRIDRDGTIDEVTMDDVSPIVTDTDLLTGISLPD